MSLVMVYIVSQFRIELNLYSFYFMCVCAQSVSALLRCFRCCVVTNVSVVNSLHSNSQILHAVVSPLHIHYFMLPVCFCKLQVIVPLYVLRDIILINIFSSQRLVELSKKRHILDITNRKFS